MAKNEKTEIVGEKREVQEKPDIPGWCHKDLKRKISERTKINIESLSGVN